MMLVVSIRQCCFAKWGFVFRRVCSDCCFLVELFADEAMMDHFFPTVIVERHVFPRLLPSSFAYDVFPPRKKGILLHAAILDKIVPYSTTSYQDVVHDKIL